MKSGYILEVFPQGEVVDLGYPSPGRHPRPIQNMRNVHETQENSSEFKQGAIKLVRRLGGVCCGDLCGSEPTRAGFESRSQAEKRAFPEQESEI